MEGKLSSVLNVDCIGDADDFKYICGLSTILVATIQEVKDRVSQMEFIFCSQLFPSFQAKLRILEVRLADTAKAAEDEWRKKEAELLSQLEELRSGKMHAEEELQRLSRSLEETEVKLVGAEQLIAMHELEMNQFLGRLEDQTRKDETVLGLEREVEEKEAEVSREKEAHQRLLRQIELKDKYLHLEQNKRKDLIEDYTQLKANYKQLKSQYTFLLGKIDKTVEFKPSPDTVGDEKGCPPNKRKLADAEEQDTSKESIQVVSKSGEMKNRPASCSKPQPNHHASSIRSPFNSSRLSLPSCPTVPHPKSATSHSKPEASSGITRPSSHWRETRARQEPGVADLHDDFLDTPMEAVKNMIRNPPEAPQALAVPPPQDMNFNNSDDETQDINVATQGVNNAPVPEQQNTTSIQQPKKGFKYIEPVRKRSDRENLKGVECKQCKKFYDAVLPDGRSNDGVNSTGMRCEHHDGISRHRYKYAPPMTPEGFWNIGFESEM